MRALLILSHLISSHLISSHLISSHLILSDAIQCFPSSRTFVIVLIASAFSAFSYVGFEYFIIKILEVQFSKDPSSANRILTGVALGSALAIIIGGYIAKRSLIVALAIG